MYNVYTVVLLTVSLKLHNNMCVYKSLQAVIPSALLLESNKPISKSNRNLAVRLTNILSGELEGDFTVKVKSVTDSAGETTKIDKPMTAESDK